MKKRKESARLQSKVLATTKTPSKGIPGALIAILFFAFLVYSHILTNQFLQWDDTLHLIPSGKVVHFGLGDIFSLFLKPYDIPITFSFWKVLTNLFLPAGAQFAQIADHAFPFHVVSILLHLVNSILVYFLAKKLSNSVSIALGACAFFAFHPMQVEAVAWVSGLKDLLSTAFVFGSILFHLKATHSPQSTRSRLFLLKALSFLLFVCACLSKQTAAITPLLLLCIYALFYRASLKTVWIELVPWFVVAALLAALTKSTQPDFTINDSVPAPLRLLVFGDAIAFYVWKIVLPVRLIPHYARTPMHILESGSIWLTWLLPAGILASLVLLRNKFKMPILSAFVLFAIAILPVSGLIPFGFQNHSTVADRYIYLAMFAPALLFGYLYNKCQFRYQKAAVATVLLMYCVMTFLQTAKWKDTYLLFSYNLRINPSSALAHIKLGNVAFDKGNFSGALNHFQRSVELKPKDDAGYQHMGLLFLETGNFEKSIQQYQEALTRDSLNAETHANLGTAYGRTADRHNAMNHFRQALILRPNLCEANLGIGYEYHLRSVFDSALVHYKKAEECTDDPAALYGNIALCYEAKGDVERAREYSARATKRVF